MNLNARQIKRELPNCNQQTTKDKNQHFDYWQGFKICNPKNQKPAIAKRVEALKYFQTALLKKLLSFATEASSCFVMCKLLCIRTLSSVQPPSF